MQPCTPESSYFATPNFLDFIFDFQSIIDIPIMVFGAYCIMFKTPQKMNTVKFLMLNLHAWNAAFVLCFSFLLTPYILLPMMACYSLGAIDAPIMTVYLSLTCLAGSSASLLLIYENRYFTLFGKNYYWRKLRKTVLFFICALVPTFPLPLYLHLPNQENARVQVSEQLGDSCLQPFQYTDRKMFVLSFDKSVLYSLVPGIGIAFTGFGAFSFLTIVNLWFGKTSLVSSKTMKLQKQFAMGIIIQSVFVTIIVMLPSVAFAWTIFGWYHNQALNNFIMIVLAQYGIGSTIVMISVHKPYRDIIIDKLCRCPCLPKSNTNTCHNSFIVMLP
ncbi:hypothetical protein CRE_19064 [Caenorhabditis remanei]|uniref:Serpentine Receptor, class H n=1 Tax=Caenorhabditis remanei TaxID=31234 RepID=E3LLK1_CAERE|nr:hypothetical protein CRE_19064 [Caenorhabditis remanei]